MMTITILGCGCAEGVPVIGCKCKVCMSKNSKNKRTRQSIYLQSSATKVLVDAGPDFRTQALSNKIHHLDAVLVTHAHSDHINGLDDLRAFSVRNKKSMDLFAHETCLSSLNVRFAYLFREYRVKERTFIPTLNARPLTPGDKYKVGDIEFMPFMQQHGGMQSMGFMINDRFAYSTDVNHLDEKALALLKDVPLWMVDCTNFKSRYPSHFNLKEVLEVCEAVRPKRVVLIHMSHEMDYNEFSAFNASAVKLPKNAELAYDGMKIFVQS